VTVTRREGALTEMSLIDAIADETQRGREANLLAVGTPALGVQALRILNLHGGLAQLVAATPAVVVDPDLGDAWELRVDDGRTSCSAAGEPME
jgi:hypothetical protein